MTVHNSVETLGYPSRTKAIIALYEQRIEQREIVRRIGCSRYAVSSVICAYRKKTGRYIEPESVAPPTPRRAAIFDIEYSPAAYARLNYRKSVSGAREALEAMSR